MFCAEKQDLRRDPERVAEFEALIKDKRAYALRSWMLWMNETYRFNCKAAGKKP